MNALQNIRIGAKLALSFSVILALLAAVSGIALWRLDTQTRAIRHLVSVEAQSLADASELAGHAQAASVFLLQILISDEREARVPLYKAMDGETAAADALMKKLHSSQATKSLGTAARNLISSRDRYSNALRESVELIETDGGPSARKQFSEATKPALDEVLQGTSKLVSELRSAMLMEQQEIDQNNQATRMFVIGLSIAALALGAILAYVVSRSIVDPIRKVVKVANRIAQGDLRLPQLGSGRDEVSQLLLAFVTMCGGLQQLVSAIRSSVEHVEVAVDEIKGPVTSVAVGSDAQRDAVAVILENVATFSGQAARVSETAIASIRHAQAARDLAERGQSMVHEASVEIDRIAVTISDSADAVERLGFEARSVRNLVVTVKEIADQTNLLALNAAIEAARAGESGRGFSVVADEVRKLAERSADATKQINSVIDIIDRETSEAVERIATGRTEMLNGASLIRKMIGPLGELSDGAQRSLEKLETLASAAEGQVRESTAIEGAVQEIANMAQDNQTAARRVTGATTDLNEISRLLGDQVRGFSLA